tara:strand:+ start:309 stop:1367 length:1059 start_codon:yes stop_codon:yes gene_type:complete
MAGLSRLIAKELSSALGITDNPKFNPAFKKADDVDFIPAEQDIIENMKGGVDVTALGLTTDFQPNAGAIEREVTTFYSPVLSSLEAAPISTKGTRGENIESFVRKKSPKVKKSETDFMGEILEGSKYYTKGEALEEATQKGFTISANVRTSKYTAEQRQELLDEPSGYFEMTLDYNRNTSKAPIVNVETHYDFNTLAHSRVSYYDYDEPFFLVEELQSDLVQNLAEGKAPLNSTTDYVRSLLQALIFEAKDTGVDFIVIPPVKKLLAARDSSLVKGSRIAFENTYNKAVKKAVKSLQNELGEGKIQTGTRELEYEDGIYDGFEIFIRDLDIDIINDKPRFYEGGLVKGLMSR